MYLVVQLHGVDVQFSETEHLADVVVHFARNCGERLLLDFNPGLQKGLFKLLNGKFVVAAPGIVSPGAGYDNSNKKQEEDRP